MKIRRFKDFIKEEFLFNNDIIPIELHKGDHYTIIDDNGNEIKDVVYDRQDRIVNTNTEVYLFEIEDYGGTTDDTLSVLPEHVYGKIFNYDEEPMKPENLIKGEEYMWSNEWSNELEGGAIFIGAKKAEIEVPSYLFRKYSDMYSIPYHELKSRVKDDQIKSNAARRKYNLY